MTIETLAREEILLSYDERQAIVDNATDAWLDTLPADDKAIDIAVLDFNARMLPEIYPDYSLTSQEIREGLQLEQRFFVLRGIANALHLDEYRATAVAQRMGVHFSVMFPTGRPETDNDAQPALFNYWAIISNSDYLAV